MTTSRTSHTRTLVAALAAAASLALLPGCSADGGASGAPGPAAAAQSTTNDPCPKGPDVADVKEADEPVAIIHAQRRDSSPQTGLPEQVCAAIIAAVKAKAPISLIRLDGQPTMLPSKAFSTTAKNDAALKKAFNDYLQAVENSVLAVKAEQPHIDVQKAMDVAADVLHSRPTSQPTAKMFVLGSLLQDTGTPNFTSPGMIDADPQDVAEFMSNNRLIPDLTGVAVTFVGGRYTAAPQQPMDTARGRNVEAIWLAIAKAGHAATVESIAPTATNNTVPHGDQLPAVSLVPIPKPVTWNPSQVYPNSGPLGFVPDKAVLLDAKAAKTALAPVPAWLDANPGCTLTITGTTARVGARPGQVALGLGRATTAKVIIVGLGGDGSRIEVVGVGSYFDKYVNDSDGHGNLVPDKAQQNRTVRFAPHCAGTA